MHQSSRIHAQQGLARACAAPHRHGVHAHPCGRTTPDRPHIEAIDRRAGRPAIPTTCRRVLAHRSFF